jgi:hypothetical protein
VKLLSVAAIVLFATSPLLCTSVPFTVSADQPNGTVILNPNGNPLLEQTSCSPTCRLQFDIDVPDPDTPTSYVFSYSFALGDQLLNGAPTALTCSSEGTPGGCSIGFSLPVDCCNKTPIAGTFVATVNGASQTFNFTYQPVVAPEPASMALLGTGLVATAYRKVRRRRQVRAC